jgi:hypothetical protein
MQPLQDLLTVLHLPLLPGEHRELESRSQATEWLTAMQGHLPLHREVHRQQDLNTTIATGATLLVTVIRE